MSVYVQVASETASAGSWGSAKTEPGSAGADPIAELRRPALYKS